MKSLPALSVVLVLLALTAAAGLGAPPSSAKEADAVPIEFHRDVVYGQAGDVELTLNLAAPKDRSRASPAILVIHGGAWIAGRKELHDALVEWLAGQGYVAATVGYRLVRFGQPMQNAWPAQIEDVKCAMRYLRANAAKWKIDPERIAAWGFSAGGHLAMLLGTMDEEDGIEGDGGHPDESSKANAVVSFYGPVDLDPEKPGRLAEGGKHQIAAILGDEFKKDPKKASPLHYVDAEDAPMILLQGGRDRLVPYLQAVDMLDALTEARIDAEVVFLVGEGHGWQRDPALSDSVRTALRFLDRRFRPARAESIPVKRRLR